VASSPTCLLGSLQLIVGAIVSGSLLVSRRQRLLKHLVLVGEERAPRAFALGLVPKRGLIVVDGELSSRQGDQQNIDDLLSLTAVGQL